MQELLLITSPPASGKTYWIEQFFHELPSQKLLVISPLRALADECKDKWGETIEVMTPEEWLNKKSFHETVVFDEFHLFFYWGDSFRPKMWEAFFELSSYAKLTVLLTATLNEKMKEEIILFSSQFDSILWSDHGNQILKYRPSHYIKAPSRQWIMKQIEEEESQTGVKLIFCKYRTEVFKVQEHLVGLGYSCLACVGGEAKYFKDKLKLNPSPDFIIATTVLSHGVNLPQITKIFFLYEVNNIDFWIQMLARGGRRGEPFEVFSLEKPHVISWSYWQNLANVIWLTFRQKMSLKVFRKL